MFRCTEYHVRIPDGNYAVLQDDCLQRANTRVYHKYKPKC